MCGPSTAVKGLVGDAKVAASQLTSDATAIWGKANDVVNKIGSVMDKVVAAGFGQFGYSQGEENAMRAQAANQSAAIARNMRGAAASSAAAIGGGNTVVPAGATQASELAASQAGAEYGAQAQNQITTSGYEVGRQNFLSAVQEENQLPGMLENAQGAEKTAMDATQTALKDQQQLDSQSNWWTTDLEKLGTGAIGAFASGFTGNIGKSLANDIMGQGPSSGGSSGGGGDSGSGG